jgi:hypothetical protein
MHKAFRLDGGMGAGLTCACEGVALAGVPLLHKSVTGFRPRSADEIDALVQSAFDGAVNASGLSPGLQVIADALNRGNIGRAMIAALHLKLPEMDQHGVGRIAKVQQALIKYDRDQPRDWHGRWTNGVSERPTVSTGSGHRPGPALRTESTMVPRGRGQGRRHGRPIRAPASSPCLISGRPMTISRPLYVKRQAGNAG